MCSPDARSLSLLLPQAPERKNCWNPRSILNSGCFSTRRRRASPAAPVPMPFLVGIAWWDAGGLQVEQFFMRDLDEEHSLLLELSEHMAKRPVLVTFNGKSFDWPLLETRYRMTRAIRALLPGAPGPAASRPPTLAAAARVGAAQGSGTARPGSEGRALDWSRDDDIDSSLIPQFYFDYLRGGPAEPLAGVFHITRWICADWPRWLGRFSVCLMPAMDHERGAARRA